ncbi:hypothetical protein DFJ74DRAFT_686761 [Hyaloraphidium curvatum]|nr:hypothetical protein DFJ74DRAFT_686761 [Hyaloraphidium curvatum]
MALARIAFPDKFAAEMGKEAATFVSTVGVGMSNSGPMGNAALCGECGAKATKDKKLQQCSRCHATWYCSRECQKEAWKLHKDRCGKEGDEVIQLGESLNTAPAATSKS